MRSEGFAVAYAAVEDLAVMSFYEQQYSRTDSTRSAMSQ
jgi:hypothetical protein